MVLLVYAIQSVTSRVTTALSVMAFIGALLLTKIWKAVAVTILRRTVRRQRGKTLFTYVCWVVLHVSLGSSHLWWIWMRHAWRRLVWPPRTCRAAVHPQVRHTQAWGSPSVRLHAHLTWSSEEQTEAQVSFISPQQVLLEDSLPWWCQRGCRRYFGAVRSVWQLRVASGPEGIFLWWSPALSWWHNGGSAMVRPPIAPPLPRWPPDNLSRQRRQIPLTNASMTICERNLNKCHLQMNTNDLASVSTPLLSVPWRPLGFSKDVVITDAQQTSSTKMYLTLTPKPLLCVCVKLLHMF